jgi:hypothetical protein
MDLMTAEPFEPLGIDSLGKSLRLRPLRPMNRAIATGSLTVLPSLKLDLSS